MRISHSRLADVDYGTVFIGTLGLAMYAHHPNSDMPHAVYFLTEGGPQIFHPEIDGLIPVIEGDFDFIPDVTEATIMKRGRDAGKLYVSTERFLCVPSPGEHNCYLSLETGELAGKLPGEIPVECSHWRIVFDFDTPHQSILTFPRA